MDSHRYLILTAEQVQTVDPTQLIATIRYNRDNSLCVIEYAISIDENFNIIRPSSIDPSWYIKELMAPEAHEFTKVASWEPIVPIIEE